MGAATIEATRRVLFSYDTQAGTVWILNPKRFISLMKQEEGRSLGFKFEVLVLKDFERVTGSMAERLLTAIERFCKASPGPGIRLVLVSEGEISPEMMGIHKLSPLVVRLPYLETDPQSLNSRVHALIDEASRITEVPIKRLSERAASFLEETYYSCEGDELLVLLVEGIRRSDGRTLRFRDLLPHFSRYFDSDDPLETYCN